MAEFRLQLDKGLTDAEALRDVLKGEIRGEIVSLRYNARTGIANLTTRAFPSIGDAPPESDASKILNAALDSIGTLRAVNEQDRIALDKREADVLQRERKLDDHEKELEKLHIELDRGDRKTFIENIKAFFHRNEQ